MHCINCGALLTPGARFCASCGAASIDPEATRYAASQAQAAAQAIPPTPQFPPPRQERTSDVERQIFTARPTMLFIKIAYIAAGLGAIIIIVVLAYYASAPWWIALPIALSMLAFPAYRHVKRNLVQYTLTNHKLEIAEGFITRRTSNYPLRQIQDVTIQANIFQRLLGYGDVIIENAGEDPGLDNTGLLNVQNPRQYADMLLRELRRFR